MQLFANNADSSLNGAIAPDTLVLALKAGEGSKFPSPSNGDYFLITLYQKFGSGEINHEIVKCTSRTGDNLTVVRAQEGTTAKAFNSGDLVELRFTKGTAENFSQPEDLATKESVIAAPVSAPTEKYWRGDKTWRDFFTDVRAATLTGLSTATNAVVSATDTVLAAIGKLQAQVSAKFDKTGGDVDGNINLTGTARRITGDFSNATIANRTLFKSGAANKGTDLTVVPNGTGNYAGVSVRSNESQNASVLSVAFNGSSGVAEISSWRTGYGAYLPISFLAGGAERLRIDPNTGNVLVTSGALGYEVGAGGTVTQDTSKSATVTLNKVCGQILMHNAALAANGTVRFTVNNAFVDFGDEVSVWLASPENPSTYDVAVDGLGPGEFAIRLRNNASTSYSDSVLLGFAVRKGATS